MTFKIKRAAVSDLLQVLAAAKSAADREDCFLLLNDALAFIKYDLLSLDGVIDATGEHSVENCKV